MYIIKALCVLCFVTMPVVSIVGIFGWITNLSSDETTRKRKKKFMITTIVGIVLTITGLFGYKACQNVQYAVDVETLAQFKVTSDDIDSDGSWVAAVTNTEGNPDRTPELSWEAYDGATEYAVVMIDEDAKWLHWLTFTDKAGLASVTGSTEYVGPYPPSGTHTYTVYVFALAAEPASVDVTVDSGNCTISHIARLLNHSYDADINILAVGKISGTYSAE